MKSFTLDEIKASIANARGKKLRVITKPKTMINVKLQKLPSNDDMMKLSERTHLLMARVCYVVRNANPQSTQNEIEAEAIRLVNLWMGGNK